MGQGRSGGGGKRIQGLHPKSRSAMAPRLRNEVGGGLIRASGRRGVHGRVLPIDRVVCGRPPTKHLGRGGRNETEGGQDDAWVEGEC